MSPQHIEVMGIGLCMCVCVFVCAQSVVAKRQWQDVVTMAKAKQEGLEHSPGLTKP